jgi:DNA mismatch endonuclease, patch repair protein
MVDNLTSEKRSWLMSRVRSRGNAKTELRLVGILRREKIWGWRRHYRIAGTPDFVFAPKRVAIFADGCFWHGCKHCKKAAKTNADFWAAKITANRQRDSQVTKLLRKRGWKALRIWEHDLRSPDKVVQRIKKALAL